MFDYIIENRIRRLRFDNDEMTQQELAEAQWRLEKTEIRAPFAGTVMAKQVVVGENVNASQTTAIRMSSMPRFFSSVITRSQNLAPSLCSIQRPRSAVCAAWQKMFWGNPVRMCRRASWRTQPW